MYTKTHVLSHNLTLPMVAERDLVYFQYSNTNYFMHQILTIIAWEILSDQSLALYRVFEVDEVNLQAFNVKIELNVKYYAKGFLYMFVSFV